MAAKRDYYELLGIPKDASEDAVKKAYRKMAMKYHPDRNPGNKAAEAKFKEISEAYEVLSDSNKRRQYDQYGHDGMKSTFGPGGFDFSRDFTHYSDLEDILGSFFGDGGGLFDGMFGGGGGGRASRTGAQRGTDLRFDLEVDFAESAFGSKRDVELPVSVECESCGGTGAAPGAKRESCKQCGGRGVVVSGGGFFHVRQTCPACGGAGESVSAHCRACDGSGRVRTRKRLSLKIPPGVETGSRLRLAGKGESGARGGPPGDLYVILHVLPHPLFERRGDDIFCQVPVPFETAVLGGDVDVPTIDGHARVRIEPGTETGRVFRLRNKGMPSLDGHSRGDHHAQIVVQVPVQLSSRQKAILKDLSDAATGDNYPVVKRISELADSFYEKKRTLQEENSR